MDINLLLVFSTSCPCIPQGHLPPSYHPYEHEKHTQGGGKTHSRALLNLKLLCCEAPEVKAFFPEVTLFILSPGPADSENRGVWEGAGEPAAVSRRKRLQHWRALRH